MKKAFLCAFITLVLGGCNSATTRVSMSDRYIDHPVDNDEFVVIYVEDDDTSRTEARKKAMERAAEVINSNGYRYFKVFSEEEVQVARSTPEERAFSGNMYQELIVEGNFGRQRYTDFPQQRTGIYPGYRLVIKCYQKKPVGKAYDACDYTNCN